MYDPKVIHDFHQKIAFKYPYVKKESWLKLEEISIVQTLKRDEVLCREGEKLNHGIFVVKGQLKLFHINESGIERISTFCTDNEYMDNWSDIHQQSPLPYSISALTDTLLIKYPLREMTTIFKKESDLLQLCIDLSQAIIQKKQEHYRILTLKSPIERYGLLLENRKEWVQAFSLTNLAKYLHISRETLSRTRAAYLGVKAQTETE
ncbi:cyclic nucleotide-binding domain-containing protein [Flagellimonas olearia]|uniref:Cyclic nucleotide-binding domain-containing protein n=1 Tax=Flagellimonas olearia TaxID=552546 RepID=A0A6I1DYB3_9FLAO|nr:Crp/Fnr family transcriptional regulator [Allomuricauda olearia]KAB7530268.1 cyclic nucleotide-binding domain-containing protein [Allomuricauda olearia]